MLPGVFFLERWSCALPPCLLDHCFSRASLYDISKYSFYLIPFEAAILRISVLKISKASSSVSTGKLQRSAYGKRSLEMGRWRNGDMLIILLQAARTRHAHAKRICINARDQQDLIFCLLDIDQSCFVVQESTLDVMWV